MTVYRSHELAALTFDSFKLSQGSPTIQSWLLEYIVAKERDRITPDALAESYEIAATRTARFIRRPDVHIVSNKVNGTRPEDHREQMDNMPKMWDKALAEADPDFIWGTVSSIRGGIALADRKYLVERDGRPRVASREGTSPNQLARPYLSQLVHYGLLGNSTGHDIYDELFDEVTTGLPGEWSFYAYSYNRAGKRVSAEMLGVVVAQVAGVHFDHYPEDYEQLSPEWKQQLLIEPTPLAGTA
jgi:hypothetical protein